MVRAGTTTSTMPRTVSDRRPIHIRASVFTLAGQGLADGVVEVSGSDDGWTATLYALDRPGKIAGAYFVTGLREIVVRLDDGRRARARIAGTRFTAEKERVFELRGVGSFVS